MFEQHKKIYQHAGKCDDQQNLKGILDAAMASTPKGVKYNSSNMLMTSNHSRNQVLGNHCVYSPTHWMLNRKQQNVLLWLQNQNAEP